MKKYHQPSGLHNGLDFLIDSEWTPEQAYAVFQLLDDLRDRILAKYELSIVELMQEECNGKFESLQLENANLRGDDNPF